MSTYQSHPFVDRQEEIKRISKELDDLKNRVPVPKPVLLFHGVTMVGKTTLLQEIRRLAVDRFIPVIFIDFDRSHHLNKEDPTDGVSDEDDVQSWVIQEVLENLNKAIGNPSSYFLRDVERGLDRAAGELVNHILQLQSRFSKPIVLLFDTLEACAQTERDSFNWLQQVVLAPLLEGRQMYIVFAGWSSEEELFNRLMYPIRRHTETYPLEPFTPVDIEEKIRSLVGGSRWLNKVDLTYLTGGLPGLIDELVDIRFEDDRALASYMVDQVIFTRLAGEHGEQMKQEVLVASTFRQFSSTLLVKTLRNLWSNQNNYYSASLVKARRQLLKNLRGVGLIENHPDLGYTVSLGIQTVLSSYERIFHPERYFQTHCIAYRLFQKEAETEPLAILNMLYHLGSVWHNSAAMQMVIPEDIPDGSDRIGQLQVCLTRGLAYLKGNKRTAELIQKITTALHGREFRRLLSKNEIDNLIVQCESFLVRYEDGGDNSL